MADDREESLAVERRLLEPDFGVIETGREGQATDGAAARLAPDLPVLDLSMPGMDGIEAARRPRASADRSVPAWRADILERLDRRVADLRRFPCLWHSVRRSIRPKHRQASLRASVGSTEAILPERPRSLSSALLGAC